MSLDAGSRLDGASQDSNRKSHIHLEAVLGGSKFPGTTTPGIAQGTVEAARNRLRRNDPTFVPHPPQKSLVSTVRQNPSMSPQLKGEPKPSSVKHESPWKTYNCKFQLKFGDYVMVAAVKTRPSDIVAVKEHPDCDASQKLDILQKIGHARFITWLDIFEHETTCYIVSEFVLVSLTEVVACPAYPTEQQLVAILAQILQGLNYLASIGLQHGSLTCSNARLKPTGDVVLANQECCLPASGSDADVRAVGRITMTLMQKYANDDDAIGIENLNRWPASSKPVKFLATTTSASSVAELEQHSLFGVAWRKDDLKILALLASFTPSRSYKFVG